MSKSIEFYNSEIDRLEKIKNSKAIDDEFIEKFVSYDSTKISWSSSLLQDLRRCKRAKFSSAKIVSSIYRPYTKEFLYFDSIMNHRQGQNPQLFPTSSHQNLLFCLNGVGAQKEFSTLLANTIPAQHLVQTGQCFPLYYYEKIDSDKKQRNFINGEKPDKDGYLKKEAITDWALEKFQTTYKDKKIYKEDIFYYIYGVLHSPDYRSQFENDLKKMLPRIPLCENFWGFSNAGRELSEWHLNYEIVKPYPLKEVIAKGAPIKEKELYRVSDKTMKWVGGKKNTDKTQLVFNQYITLSEIPLDSYDYIINGKSAIEWIMERYTVTVDLNAKGEGSGIENDPNEWSADPRYIIDLVKRIVSVSIETNKIVAKLPPLNILP